MEGQPILIGRLHLVISLTILLLLVEIPMTVDQAPSQLNYSILIQINGRPKLHFLTAQNRELIFELHLGLHIFSLHMYGIVSRADKGALIMGGNCDGTISSLIARYRIENKWEQVGHLQNSRHRFRAIGNDGHIYVVGGGGTL